MSGTTLATRSVGRPDNDSSYDNEKEIADNRCSISLLLVDEDPGTTSLCAKFQKAAMNYQVPNELEFFERGFGLSGENDPDEGLFSYMCSYDNGKQLIFTHSPFSGNSISIKLIEGNETLAYLYQEGVLSIEFQTWDESKIIRVYFEANVDKELRISYFPRPSLHIAELT